METKELQHPVATKIYRGQLHTVEETDCRSLSQVRLLTTGNSMPTIPSTQNKSFLPRADGSWLSTDPNGEGGGEPEIPSVPSAPSLTVGDTQLSVSWTAVAGATTYDVIYNTSDSTSGATAFSGNPVSDTSAVITGLTNDTRIYVFVRASNATGSSAYSGSATATPVEPAEGDIVITGTVAHGETITLTTEVFNFGTRTNVKPLYVNIGDSKAGSSLGRVTTDFFVASAESQSIVANGEAAGSVCCDLKGEHNATFQGMLFDADKPLIAYLERYYDFDITQSQYQNGSGGFNLKTNRMWYGNPGDNNIYVGYQGSEGGNARLGAENMDNNKSNYYGAGVPPSEWLNEEFIVRNSSAPDVRDGGQKHYRSNVWLNSDNDYLQTTYSDHNPGPVQYLFLDQVSNGLGSGVSEVLMYFGIMVIDDEFNAVYVGDAATRSACTKLVRLPQTAWATSSISAVFLDTFVAPADAYFYVRTGESTWVSDSGYQQ